MPGGNEEMGGEAWQMAERVVGNNPRTVVLPTFLTKAPMKFVVE
jgi:hypothetical protein